MALSKIDVSKMITGVTPLANGGTGGTSIPATNLASGVTGTLPVGSGGTGITSGTTDQFLKFTGTTTVASSAVSAGITEADQWRVTANFTGDASPVSSNWERNDTSFDKIGTGMTESSGIFTFPSTGIWWIKYEGVSEVAANTQNRWNDWKIEATTNNSSYSLISATGNSGQVSNSGNSGYSSAQASVIFDVTNVSTHKVRFAIDVNDGNTITRASSTYQYHGTTFIRLGDT